MSNEEVTLMEIVHLCNRFNISFRIDNNENGYLTYYFGDISYLVSYQEGLKYHDYIQIIMKLAATYPKKILGEAHV